MTWDRAAARTRLEAATPGPWRTYDSRGSKGVEDDEGMLFIENFGVTRAVNPADAEFIAHARTDLPAALDAIDRVHALHTVEERCHDGSGEWSVARADWDREYEPEVFLICSHCGRIEMRESQGESEFASYLDALWPCATVRALDGDDRG